GTIHVIGTVPVNEGITVAKNITIKSDDKLGVLQRALGNTGYLITSSAAKFALTDITLDGNGNAVNNAQKALLCVAGGETSLNAGAKLINNINIEAYCAGGAYVTGGILFINDGSEISGNTAQYGGGVTLAESGSATMWGGTITRNTGTRTSNDSGGGVHMYTSGCFNMAGGTITGNTTHGQGGGISYESGSALNVGGKANITGNIKLGSTTGNNVFLHGVTVLTVSATFATGGHKIGVSAVDAKPNRVIANVFNNTDQSAHLFSDDGFLLKADTTAKTIKLVPDKVYIKSTGDDINAGTNASPFKTIKKAYEMVADGGTIYVMDEVPVLNADNITVESKTVVIQSDVGSTGKLKRTNDNKGELITIGDKGVVTLKNITVDGGAIYDNNPTFSERITEETVVGGVVTHRGYHGQLVVVNEGGVFNLDAGGKLVNNAIAATDNTPNDRGSAIWVVGTANIKSGSTIANNYLSGYASDGAAFSVYTATGTVNMTGGDIKHNYADRMGSAVRLSNGTINMSGGSIYDNNGVANTWGAICHNSGTLNLSGTAIIKGNMQGGFERNLYLCGDALKIDAAITSADASIGISSASPTIGAAMATVFDTADYASKFFYDGGAFKITTVNKKLVLKNSDKIYVASNGADTNPGTFEQPYKSLEKAYAMAETGSTIFVKDNITDNDDFVLNEDKAITITSCDKYGKTITDADVASKKAIPFTITAKGVGNHFTMRGNASLTINNLTIKDDSAKRNGRLFMTNDGGTPSLTLGFGATLTGGNTAYSGGAIFWKFGTLTMAKGSVIMSCTSAIDGGAVYLAGGTFAMNGSITANSAVNGGGVYYGNGIFTVGGNAGINGNTTSKATVNNANNVFLPVGKYITVSAALASGAIGVTTQAPLADSSKVQIAGGAAATAAMFVNDRKANDGTSKEMLELIGTDVYIVTKNENTNISMGITLEGETTVRGANSWGHEPANAYVKFNVPYEPISGQLTLTTRPENSKAKITYNGTVKTDTIATGTAGETLTTKIVLPLDADSAKNVHYFTVTAENGDTKQYTVTLTKQAQTAKTATFNFDGTVTGRMPSTSKVSFKGASKVTGTYSITSDKEGKLPINNLTLADTNDIISITAKLEYYDAIANKDWEEVTIGTPNGIRVASYKRLGYIYKGGNYIGEVTLHTNNASTTDLTIVTGMSAKLPNPTYMDAYQNAADAKAASNVDANHPQKNSFGDINVNNTSDKNTDSKDVNKFIDVFVKKAANDYVEEIKNAGSGDVYDALFDKGGIAKDPAKFITFITEKEFIAPIA
ncbi:MAG: hypothetical protein RR234_03970, partial [Christensenella sp.]